MPGTADPQTWSGSYALFLEMAPWRTNMDKGRALEFCGEIIKRSSSAADQFIGLTYRNLTETPLEITGLLNGRVF